MSKANSSRSIRLVGEGSKQAAIYVRISSDVTGDRLGIKRQEEDCRRLCDENGWAVVDVFKDNDISASKSVPRPSYDLMMEAVKSNEIQIVVAYAVDRLYRRLSDLEGLITIAEKHRIEIRTVSSGDINLSTADGRMTARILTSVAQKESERSGERISRKHHQMAAAGLPAGNMRSFGYNSDGSINKPEAKIVRQLVSRFISGESLHSLTNWLNEKQVISARGNVGKWRLSTVRSLIASAKISGQRERTRKSKHLQELKPAFGEIVGDAIWDAIVTPEETATIRLILNDPQRKTTRDGRFLLTGVLKCGKCGSTMNARPDSRTLKRRYSCIKAPGTDRCGKTSIIGKATDALVLKAVAHALNTADRTPVKAARDNVAIRQAEMDKAAAKARLKAAGSAWGAGEITDEVWDAILVSANAIIKECDKLISTGGVKAVRRRPLMTGDEFLKQAETMSTSAVRGIVKEVCAEIVALPATAGQNSFDPKRLKITLRK